MRLYIGMNGNLKATPSNTGNLENDLKTGSSPVSRTILRLVPPAMPNHSLRAVILHREVVRPPGYSVTNRWSAADEPAVDGEPAKEPAPAPESDRPPRTPVVIVVLGALVLAGLTVTLRGKRRS